MTKQTNFEFGTKGGNSNNKSRAPRCYESHPPLSLGGGVVVGGSSGFPAVADADIYVALDRVVTHLKLFPWDGKAQLHFPIEDMWAPASPEDTHKLITYLCNQLQAGKKVHIGCVGGHGRTGTILAALVSTLGVSADAIGWVRKHYCERSVESSAQVSFLVTHFGVARVPELKSLYKSSTVTTYTTTPSSGYPNKVFPFDGPKNIFR